MAQKSRQKSGAAADTFFGGGGNKNAEQGAKRLRRLRADRCRFGLRSHRKNDKNKNERNDIMRKQGGWAGPSFATILRTHVKFFDDW